MLPLGFSSHPPRSILLLGAHSDDIEIGCGGTILRLLRELPEVEITWVVFSARAERRDEAQRSAELFLANARQPKIVLKEFRDGYFPYTGAEIKDFFEHLKRDTSPDLIFTHCRHDLHQDHRLLCELTWNTWRDHLILEYEIPKYDGDLASPNFFAHLDAHTCQVKIDYILRCFQTQENKHWFSKETFLALLRLRGIESRAPEQYAEAFYCRKLVM